MRFSDDNTPKVTRPVIKIREEERSIYSCISVDMIVT